VSVGPDTERINVPGGGTINLGGTDRPLSDEVVVINFAGNALYDMAERGSWMWNTTGAFYQTHNLEYHEFDYTLWRLTTGPWFVGKRSVLKIPVGYAGNIYEHEFLYNAFDFSPNYEYFFTPRVGLRTMFSYVRETYRYSAIPADDRTGQDNINRIIEFNPNFYFNNRNDILSFFISDENKNAKENRWSYDALNLAASYFKHFFIRSWDMEFYTRYKYTQKDFDAPALLWPASHPRKDTRHNFYAVLSRNFAKYWYASLYYNYIDNQSNTEIYDFDKYIFGFNLGLRF
jgi:hypothetical protein